VAQTLGRASPVVDISENKVAVSEITPGGYVAFFSVARQPQGFVSVITPRYEMTSRKRA
jgi:hypothetical protein